VKSVSASDAGGARDIPISYAYGPFGVLRKVTDANQNVIESIYDIRGRKSQSKDPDAGWRILTHNAFGDVTAVSDPNGATSFVPDVLGRPTSVTSPDGTATFTWDTATNGIGRLASTTSTDGITQTMTYDALSLPSTTTWQIENESYSITTTYDNVGRPDTITYPDTQGWPTLKTQHHYAANGQLTSVTDVPVGSGQPRLFWKLDDVYAAGQTKLKELGNGAFSTYTVDEARNVLTGITTQIGAVNLQSLGYDYDANLNLKTRTDALAGVVEDIVHDSLDRVHTWSRSDSVGWNVTYGQDDIGNLTGRALVGDDGSQENLVFQHSGLNAGPHAITSSAWGAYQYDGKGNPITSPAGGIEYNAFDLPKSIAGTVTSEFKYSSVGARVLKQSSGSDSPTVYVGGLYERRGSAGARTHVLYLSAGPEAIGQIVRQ
jgi:YD repeat-containing protein